MRNDSNPYFGCFVLTNKPQAKINKDHWFYFCGTYIYIRNIKNNKYKNKCYLIHVNIGLQIYNL